MTINVNETLRLELLNETHAQPLFELVAANRNYLSPWLPWVVHMQSVTFIQNFIRGSVERNHNGNEYAFVIIENEQMVGRVGVYKIDTQNSIGEIGYWVAENQQGKGIGLTATAKLIDYCFHQLHLNRIEIKCSTANSKSQLIPERLHFTKEGIIRQGEWVHDRFVDLYLYSLIKTDCQ